MLDQICIFTKAGIVLWSKNFVKIKGKSPVAELVDILLQEQAGESTCTIRNYTLKWVRANKDGIEFFVVVVYSSLLTLSYVDDLLEAVKKNFLRQFEDDLKDNKCVAFEYDKEFDIILRAAETRNSEKKKNNKKSSNLVRRHICYACCIIYN
jgi:signal recognition particle receptor subunit alpha